MKYCITCGETKPFHEYYKYLKKVGKDHDGYRPHCKPCTIEKRAIADKKRLEEPPIMSTTEAVVKAILKVPGMDNWPCGGCYHYNRCRDSEVDCRRFRVWTDKGRKNKQLQVPDRYLTGEEFVIEL